MSNRWGQIFTFEELISAKHLFLSDGYRAKNEELGGEGIIFLRSGHVTDTHIDFSGADRFKQLEQDAFKSKVSQPGDVVITTKGNSVGRVTYVDHEMPRFVYSPHLSFWRSLNHDTLLPGFLRYWSRSMEFQSQLKSMAYSTDMAPYLSLVDQRRLRVSLPPIEQQREIAHILGSLDDKIELNRRMNATLEATARAIFQSWFVDFDPVHAKARGEQPIGMDAEIAALFPDSFEDSELGMIPAGWRVGDIYELAKVIYGAPFSSKQFNSDGLGYPLIRIRDLKTNHPEVFTPEEHPNATVIEPGDIVVGMDGEFRAYRWQGVSSYLNQRVCTFVPQYPYLRTYVYETIAEPLAFYERAKIGTTVIHLGKSDIDTFRVLISSDAVLRVFGDLVEPLIARVVTNTAESRSLAEIRDALLPKLISGEVRCDMFVQPTQKEV